MSGIIAVYGLVISVLIAQACNPDNTPSLYTYVKWLRLSYWKLTSWNIAASPILQPDYQLVSPAWQLATLLVSWVMR